MDAHVAKEIFENCILGYLKNKTRIMVMHQLQFLKYATRIIVLHEGRIIETGTFEELSSKQDGHLRKLLDEFTVQEEAITAATAQEEKKANDQVKPEMKVVQEPKKGGRLMQEEERSTGGLSFSVVWAYIMAAGGPIALLFNFGLFSTAQLGILAGDWWLSQWSSGKFSYLTTAQMLGIYGGIGGVSLVLVLFRNVILGVNALIAAYRLHAAAFARIIRAPVCFFS